MVHSHCYIGGSLPLLQSWYSAIVAELVIAIVLRQKWFTSSVIGRGGSSTIDRTGS